MNIISLKAKSYKLLDHPLIYRVAQQVASCGGALVNQRIIRRMIEQLPKTGTLLDIGCGPASRFFPFGLSPFGLDLSEEYIRNYTLNGGKGIVASADQLPFAANSFDGIWSIGLLHHLPQDVAENCLAELGRILKPGGYVVLFDAALPRSPWKRPLAQFIRRLDRGKHMRFQEQFEAMLPNRARWKTKRYTYTITGLEMLLCTYHKEG